MDFIVKKLTQDDIAKLRRKYGVYIKLTIDVDKECVVAGGELQLMEKHFYLKRKVNKIVFGEGELI